ncbi:hypothetical protein DFS34DRAFT_607785 [Phlyctochytrium arcticum]|nr:hypothetical protein DFS34DRAFT_607785 [Phlyctochytrium arcticum]
MPPTLEHSALAASRTSPNVRGSIRSKKASSKTQSSTPPTTVGPHRNTRASRAKRNVSGKRRPIQSATSNTDFNEVSRGLISGITNPSHPTEATSKHPSYHSTHAYHYATALADQAYQAAHFLPSGPTGRSIQQHASGELPWIMPTPQLAPTLGTLVGADYIPRRYLVTKFRKMGYKYFGDVNSADCWIGVYGPSVAPETQPQETPQDPVDGTDDSTSPLPPPVSSQAHSDDRPSSHVLYGLIPAHSAFLSGLSPFFSRCLSSARRDLAAGVIRPVPGPLLRLHDLQVADLNNSTVTHKYPLYRPTNGDDADGTATSPKPHSEGAPASSHQTGPLVTTPVLPHETVPLPHQIFLPVAPPSCEALVPLIHWLYVKDVTALRSFLARHDDTAPSAVKATALWLGLDIDAEFWQVMDGWESDVKEGRVILDDMA